MKENEITIKLIDGDAVVTCKVIDSGWAIHRTPHATNGRREWSNYSITHIKSGLSALHEIEELHDAKFALSVLKDQEINGVPWADMTACELFAIFPRMPPELEHLRRWHPLSREELKAIVCP